MEQRGEDEIYSKHVFCFIASTAPFFASVTPLTIDDNSVVLTTSLVVSYLGGYIKGPCWFAERARAKRRSMEYDLAVFAFICLLLLLLFYDDAVVSVGHTYGMNSPI